MTNQPDWEFLVNLGDANPIDYGGKFVYRDRTGIYGPEMVILEPLEDPDGQGEMLYWMEYRVMLDRCTYIDGVLSDNQYHPEMQAWFAWDLAEIALWVDVPVPELLEQLCSDDPIMLARGYESLGHYFGWFDFDSYPLKHTRRQDVERRFKEECVG